jgi:hypothetical protein
MLACAERTLDDLRALHGETDARDADSDQGKSDATAAICRSKLSAGLPGFHELSRYARQAQKAWIVPGRSLWGSAERFDMRCVPTVRMLHPYPSERFTS